ncbi:DUF2919 family protein [Colwellia sp. MEBiC06753]
MSEQFRNFSVSDFDQYDCVKLAKVLYVAIAFLLRGYLVWLMSVTNFNDRIGVIQWVYPDQHMFYVNLISGSLGLLVVLLISLRRPNASQWVKRFWPYTKMLVIAAIAVDMMVLIIAYYLDLLTSASNLLVQVVTGVICILLVMTSQRLKINLREFPEPLPER